MFNGSISIHPDPTVKPTDASLWLYAHCQDSNGNQVYDMAAEIRNWVGRCRLTSL